MHGLILYHTYQIYSNYHLISHTPDSRLPIPDSRFPIPYSLLPTPYSLLPTPYSLLPTPYSLLPTPYSLYYDQLSIGKAPGRTVINLVLPLRSTSTSNWAPTSEASTPC
ncbi:MAG: hypothetical protein F6J90_29590 [Moorea sp. SIOASIH]|uniref:hypothetical protein n=1 Tax=Moorena sp. SIOASIH TaxID=2607817 RepID=UPI0013BCEF8C|nr:hypothetical protein [Moorena sp. SIOASIH]NEO40275.1 hypothetical protein [Moorena sp. SIOASIH]